MNLECNLMLHYTLYNRALISSIFELVPCIIAVSDMCCQLIFDFNS